MPIDRTTRLHRLLRTCLFPTLLLVAATIARAATPTPAQDGELWYSVHLDGRKIGHLHSARSTTAGVIRSERRLELQLERNGEPLVVRSEEIVDEDLDGAPLGFETTTDLAGSRSHSVARIVDGEVRVRTEQPGQPGREQRYPWPPGSLLAEGQRRLLQTQSLAPGSEFVIPGFDPTSQRGQHTRWQVGEAETVDIHGRPERLLAVRQTVDPDEAAIEISAWLRSDDRAVRRLRLPALGLQLELLACDRACALAPVQPGDVLGALLVDAPRRLGARERSRPLEYRLRVDAQQAAALGDLPGQSLLARRGERARIAIDPAGGSAHPPQPADLEPTRWLQSDADEVRLMASTATADLDPPAAKMRALEAAVRRHIAVKSLRIGYASALEALQLGEGDCTEHALLLAALARAAGIPARVATGIAYAERFGERRRVFVPHAWVIAWVDGRWQGFDAALPGHGSGHIAFAADHGDPFRFYRGLELLGRLRIESVVAGAVAEHGR